ncbi:MAG: hypothetical protein ACJ70T_06125, partial [Nitrososphaera sp.]
QSIRTLCICLLYAERETSTTTIYSPLSHALLSNHLPNLKIKIPADIVRRDIARKLGCIIDWSPPGAVDR